MVKSSIIFLFFLVTTTLCFQDNINIVVPNNTLDIDYSPNQQFLAILTPQNLIILHAQSLKPIKSSIKALKGHKFTSFAFSSDSSFLIIGLELGNAFLYQLNEQRDEFFTSNKTFSSSTNDSFVDDVCFLSESVIVLAINKEKIALWNIESDKKIELEQKGKFVTDVSCSPLTNSFASLIGVNYVNKLSFFTYDQNENNISIIKQIDLKLEEKLFGITYSLDGLNLYAVGVDKNIWNYNTNDYNKISLTKEGEIDIELQQVRVSHDNKIIAVAGESKILIFQSVSSSLNSLKASQSYASPLESVALAAKGKHVFYLRDKTTGVDLAMCPKGNFYNQNGSCSPCNKACMICWSSQQECYDCIEKYYYKQNQCIQCQVGCLICDEKQCSKCDSSFVKVDTRCQCPQKYFLNVTVCSPCMTHCLNCVDNLKCTQCQQPYDPIDGICSCKQGTFVDGDTCTDCLNGCLQCNDTQTCKKCNPLRHFILKENTCVCDSQKKFTSKDKQCVCVNGTYLSQNTCLSCPMQCLTCSVTAQCTSCKGNQTLNEGKCSCGKTDIEIYDPLQDKCVKCQEVLAFCEQCVSLNECKACTTLDREVYSGQCLCKKGKYEDENKDCQVCEGEFLDGCIDCSSPTTCKQCNAQNGWKLNKTSSQCICADHYYHKDHSCLLCTVDYCEICKEDGSCIKCDENRQLISNSCKCVGGFYEDQNKKCQLCIIGCQSCKNGETCDVCDSDNHFVLKENKCVCNSSYYPKQNICISCTKVSLNCKTCTSTSCLTCEGSLSIQNNSCVCSNSHQYQQKTKCLDCSQSCLTCTENADKCTSCNEGQNLDGTVCNHPSMSTGVIIAIAIGGVVVLAIISLIVLKVVHKRRQSLRKSYYQELE